MLDEIIERVTKLVRPRFSDADCAGYCVKGNCYRSLGACYPPLP